MTNVDRKTLDPVLDDDLLTDDADLDQDTDDSDELDDDLD